MREPKQLPIVQMFVYTGVASTAMGTGRFVDTPKDVRGDAHLFLGELGLWFALILFVRRIVVSYSFDILTDDRRRR